MLKVISGIGSRETPENILTEMTAIGDWCRRNKIYVRSGHAPGADQAFERGALEYCIAYLPWRTFEEKSFNNIVKYKVPTNWKELLDHAAKYHPAWGRLKDSVRKLMARNSAQVLGLNLQLPVQAVVCYTIDGGPSGGTGQALRIAAANKILIINMYRAEYNTANKVISTLVELHSNVELSSIPVGGNINCTPKEK